MGGFSQSRNFLGGAISTISTPLRNSAEIGFHCSSPVTPRRPYSRNEEQDSSSSRGGNSRKTSIYTDSTYLPTPRNFVLQTPNHKRSRSDENEGDKSDYYDYTQSDITLVSPPESARLLPPTPSFRLDAYSIPEAAKLGTFSAINIILGKTVGVGIYSIPSSILQSVGSVGASLTLWVIGSLISFCGLAVYLDLGTALPRSGGERIYLERIFRKPRMLATCAFMSYVVLLGFSTPNCIVLGEYIIIAVAVITLTCFIHARYPRLGLRIINILGVGKMFFVLIVILSGLAGLLMKVGSNTSVLLPRRLNTPSTEFIPLPHPHLSTAQRNFSHLFAHSSTQPYDYATALLKILYCFRGYSTANQVLSSVRDPIRTLRTAAPIALSLVSLAYILANIAYFLVVEIDDFKTAGVVVAGHFFKNIFGEVIGENVLPVAVVVSAFGNIAATSFAQARVNQELGNDGLLPFSRFLFARTTGAENPTIPIPGLFLHWFVSVLVIIVPPPGEIYNFLVDIGGYPVSVISVAISGVFLLSNCLLLVLPWMKPVDGREEGRFVYYAYPATAVGVLGSGVVYWVGWRVWGRGREGEREREREVRLGSWAVGRK
ncbi:high-affinity methionine permease protein [Rutstroemia sp. NJR-2017a BBW]|nr:high-affinity methionine permease protein [Rutstroemia sp. NJR-2017a BBW]